MRVYTARSFIEKWKKIKEKKWEFYDFYRKGKNFKEKEKWAKNILIADIQTPPSPPSVIECAACLDHCLKLILIKYQPSIFQIMLIVDIS